MSASRDTMPMVLPQVRSLASFTEALLRDTLDWPIPDHIDDPEELTFDYTPEELGVPEKHAAKITRICQLRPLVHGQPWAVFWVEFEPKRLPITVLRRILNAFVEKRRARDSKRATWKMHDLLFASAHGDGDNRGITFAHFTQPENGYTAVLREFTWNKTETNLAHIGRYVECLRWPKGTVSQQEWRERWRSAFVGSKRKSIRDARTLAEEMAVFARDVRGRVVEVLEVMRDSGSDPLRHLYGTFKKVLVHDLEERDFADYYAQTMAYGLFTARFAKPHQPFSLRDLRSVADAIPETNPFLRDLFKQCFGLSTKGGGRIDIEEIGLARLVELFETLAEEDIRRIMDEFGSHAGDPVIHFYEGFLKAYDAEVREMRGVYYTPDPVVSYIVRSVHELLIRDFKCPLGLADTSTWAEVADRNGIDIPEGINPAGPFVRILDPACGTGTFLKFTMRVIHDTMMSEWLKEKNLPADALYRRWNEYVDEHLLPRLYGFELLPAPYAVCHMKLGLYLRDLGYDFGSGKRLNVFLTNALEPPHEFFDVDVDEYMAHEAHAASQVKCGVPITVVIGNPPYSGLSANMSDWTDALIKQPLPDPCSAQSYYTIDGSPLDERKLWLQDDYVKFFRLAQWRIELSSIGLLGYVTNHGYVDNPTFRGMRQSLLHTFDQLHVLNLHGNSNKKEKGPNGAEDDNVFDIRQGVAIGLLVRGVSSRAISQIDIWGSREEKYRYLATRDVLSTGFVRLHPKSSHYYFCPQSDVGSEEYQSWWKLPDVFRTSTVGFVTARDSLTIQFTRNEVWDVIRHFLQAPEENVRKLFGLREDARDWKVSSARRDLRASGPKKNLVVPVLYRPFDVRYTYYTGSSRGWYASPCRNVMQHMLSGANVSLCFCRREELPVPYGHFLVTRHIAPFVMLSGKAAGSLAPLIIDPQVEVDQELFSDGEGNCNLSQAFLDDMALRVGGERMNRPLAILNYVYAVAYSPRFRCKYDHFLRVDFPRIPLPRGRALFDALVPLGERLVSLHLMDADVTREACFTGSGTNEVVKPTYDAARQAIHINSAQSFAPVAPEVWDSHIGAYQVCHKWLKDRKGRTLTPEDIEHYRYIVAALAETIILMARIDEEIEKHGGWPDAFASG